MIQGLGNGQSTENPPFTPSGNPVWDEIQQAHSTLSPAAQRAISMSGVPQRAAQAEAAPIAGAPPTSPQAPLAPIAAPSAMKVRGLGGASSPAPSFMPLMGGEARPVDQQSPVSAPVTPEAAHLGELNRVTAAPLPSSSPLAHTSADTGRSGIGQIHNKFLRGLARVGDVVGSTFLPNLTSMIPGTELHHRDVVEQDQGIVGADQGRATGAATREHEAAQTEALQHPHTETKDKFQTVSGGIYDLVNHKWEVEPSQKDKDQLLEVDPEKGKALGITPTSDGHYFIPPQAAGELLKPVAVKQPTNVGEKWLSDHPNGTADEFKAFMEKNVKAAQWSAEDAALLRAVGGNPDKPETQTFPVMKKFRDLKTEKVTPPPADHGQNFVDPATHKLVRVEPGGAVPEGGVLPSQAGPTTQMRNVAAQAQLVHEQTPHMLSELDRLQGKIGPLAGRWNEVMQGKVGMEDSDFAGLRADMLMYSSAVALMHARGRLPENLRAEFDRMINNPGQNFQNLKSVMTRIDDWTVKNSTAMGATPGGAQHSASGGSEPTMDEINAEVERRRKAKGGK